MGGQAPSDATLARFLAGEADAAERSAVESWVSASEENRAALERLREAWRARPATRQWDVDAAWRRVSGAMEDAADVRAMPTKANRSWLTSPALRIAAVFAIIAGGAFAWRAFMYAPDAAGPEGVAMVFATAIGEQRRVDLSDGTVVTLSPASELRVGAGYGTRDRRVELTGEAWFEVVSNERRPFEVHAGGTITRDIATAFSVRALAGDSVVRVVMVEGVASLRRSGTAPSDGVTLNARDVGTVGTAGAVRVERGQDVGTLTAWRTGYLEYINATLDEVATDLQRWHPVTLQFGDSALLARRVTAPLPAANLAESLEILGRVLGVRFERSGDTVVVR